MKAAGHLQRMAAQQRVQVVRAGCCRSRSRRRGRSSARACRRASVRCRGRCSRAAPAASHSAKAFLLRKCSQRLVGAGPAVAALAADRAGRDRAPPAACAWPAPSVLARQPPSKRRIEQQHAARQLRVPRRAHQAQEAAQRMADQEDRLARPCALCACAKSASCCTRCGQLLVTGYCGSWPNFSTALDLEAARCAGCSNSTR